MAPSDSDNQRSALNTLLQKKAEEQKQAGVYRYQKSLDDDEDLSVSSLAQVDILMLPKTSHNRPQDAREFDEGEFSPIKPEEIKRAKKEKKKLERGRQRQKMVIQKRRVKKRRRVFLQRMKHMANLLSFFMLGVAIWVLIANPMWQFDGKNFTVHNSHLLGVKQLAPIMAQFKQTSVYQIEPRSIEAVIKKQYPVVDQLYVRRSIFPTHLDITVIEKIPFAEIYPYPSSSKPVTLATFEGDANRYSVVPLKGYTYQPAGNPSIVKLVVPPGYRLDQTDWQRLDHLMHQANQIPGFPLQAVQLLPTPKSEQSRFPLTAVIHYPGLLVFAGTLDAEVNQRVARLPLFVGKLQEVRSSVEAVDLRWSDQITLLKKGAPLPIATKPILRVVNKPPAAVPKKTAETAPPDTSHVPALIDAVKSGQSLDITENASANDLVKPVPQSAPITPSTSNAPKPAKPATSHPQNPQAASVTSETSDENEEN